MRAENPCNANRTINCDCPNSKSDVDTCVRLGMKLCIKQTKASRDILFATGGTEKGRIDASGNFWIGKGSLEYDSDAGIVLRIDGLLSAIRDGGNAADFNRLSSHGEIVRFSKDGADIGSLGSYNNS